jgi:radical SAM superfamily enzyme YgiQ (UPF0313 family)
LASYLAQFYPIVYADFEISIGTPNSPSQIRRFERKVREYFADQECDILAISCWTSLSFQSTMVVARIFREMYPDRLIVVGGYHPTAVPDDFLSPDNLIDYVIGGEGEHALKEIAEAYTISGRPDKTTIVKSPPFGLDSFVGYNWEIVDNFARTHLPDGVPSLFMYVSRGCPFACSFCMEPLKDRTWRAFSPEKSIEEVVYAVKRFGAGAVAISDACFGMRSAWRKEFLRRLVDLNPDFWVVVETRPEYLDEEDVKLLSQLRIEIQLGIESCSTDMLCLMKKTRVPDKFLNRFRETSHMLSDYGVLHRANLIMNYPGETRQTLDETFGFIDSELRRENTYLMWALARYMHFPGCELYSHMSRYERDYGSQFLCDEWWKKPEDQYDNTVNTVPSADLAGENVDRWRTMFQSRHEAMKATLAPDAFSFAASKYFPEWKNDPRYSQS